MIKSSKTAIDPRLWSTEQKLTHALAIAERLVDKLSPLATIWLKEADALLTRLNQTTVPSSQVIDVNNRSDDRCEAK